METNIKNLEGCQREVEVTLTKHELEPHFRKAYQAAQPEITIKGFRKGRVPLEVIRKRFGSDIENSALEDIINDVFGEITKEKEIRIIGRPTLRNRKRNLDGSLTFVVVYDEMPEITLGEYKGITADKPVTEVNDELVDSEIERICLEQGTLEEAEQVEDENFVVTITIGPGAEGADTEETKVFLADKSLKPGLKQSLLNTKAGDTFEYDFSDAEDEEHNLTRSVRIKEIHRIIPAEFSNDFVERITGGKFVSTEEFREDVERELRKSYTHRSEKVFENALIDKLIEMHDFPVPQSLVQEMYYTIFNQEKERYPDKKLPENFDMDRFSRFALPQAERSARWFLLRELIVEKEGLNVEDADVDRYAEEIAANTQLPFEQIRDYIKANEKMGNQIISEKALKLIVDYAIANEVEYQPEH